MHKTDPTYLDEMIPEHEESREKILASRKRKLQRIQKLGNSAAGVLAIITLAIALVGIGKVSQSGSKLHEASVDLALETVAFNNQITSRLEKLDSGLSKVEGWLDRTEKLPENVLLAVKVDEMRITLKAISEKQRIFDNIIVADPEKALVVPILQKDLEAVKASATLEAASMKAEIARIYDFNKWFLSMIATMALSMLAVVFNKFMIGKTTSSPGV